MSLTQPLPSRQRDCPSPYAQDSRDGTTTHEIRRAHISVHPLEESECVDEHRGEVELEPLAQRMERTKRGPFMLAEGRGCSILEGRTFILLGQPLGDRNRLESDT